MNAYMAHVLGVIDFIQSFNAAQSYGVYAAIHAATICAHSTFLYTDE